MRKTIIGIVCFLAAAAVASPTANEDYVDRQDALTYTNAVRAAGGVVSNIVTKSYVEDLGISGGGSVPKDYTTTNAVKSIVDAEVGGTNSVAHFAKDNAGGYTTLLMSCLPDATSESSRGENSIMVGLQLTTGLHSFALGEACYVEGDYSVGFGNSVNVYRNYSFSHGYSTYCYGDYGIALGYCARVGFTNGGEGGYQSTHDYAFCWNGDYNSFGGYQSHTNGTFNINPHGGLEGFWIGETNFVGHVTNIVNGMGFASDVTVSNLDVTVSNLDVTVSNLDVTVSNLDVTVSNLDVTVSGKVAKLTGVTYDFQYGTNFTQRLYETLTNVIDRMGGSVTNVPNFETNTVAKTHSVKYASDLTGAGEGVVITLGEYKLLAANNSDYTIPADASDNPSSYAGTTIYGSETDIVITGGNDSNASLVYRMGGVETTITYTNGLPRFVHLTGDLEIKSIVYSLD